MRNTTAATKIVQKKGGSGRLVLEHHYTDGDCGAYKAVELAESRAYLAALWGGFSKGKGHKPSHIVIRPDTKVGQAISNNLLTAGRFDLKREIEGSIVSLVKNLKEKAKHYAGTGKVKYTGSAENAGEILWVHALVEDMAISSRSCGHLESLFGIADAAEIKLTAEVEALREWRDVINPS